MTAKTSVLRPYRDRFPTLGQRAYVDPGASVIGIIMAATQANP